MSLKQELEIWVEAVARYDNNEFEESIRLFEKIGDTSKILFNLGVIHATLGEHPDAVECFRRALKLDPYLAIAYFQCGVSNFLMGNSEDALRNFNDALLWLRGNSCIDYEQLQLKYKLYTAEILFNRGLCYTFLGKADLGMQDLVAARNEKATEDHDVIDEAIEDKAEGYTVFSIPVGTVYRPAEVKVKNLGVKDYLGKARLVATSDRSNTHTAFTGAENLKARDPAVAHQLLSVPTSAKYRTRQQSEPPVVRSAPLASPQASSRPSTKLSPGARKELIASLRLDNLSTTSMQRRPAAPQRPSPNERKLGPKVNAHPMTRHGTTRTASEPRTPKDFASIKSSARRRPSGPIIGVASRNGADNNLGGLGSGGSRDRRAQTHPELVRRPGTAESQSAQAKKLRSKDPEHVGSTRRYELPDHSASDTRDQKREVALHRTTQASPGATNGSAAAVGGSQPSSANPLPAASLAIPSNRHTPALRVIRLKLRTEEIRYIMVYPNATYHDLRSHVREKLHLTARFKMRIKDEDGEEITLGDQEDLEAFIMSVRDEATKRGVDTGKGEIWVQSVG